MTTPDLTPDTPPTPPALSTVYTDADLARIAFGPTEWIIEDLLTPGLTLLAGAPKIGKGWLALQFVLDVAHNRDTIGRATLPDCETLYLALEDGPSRLSYRMRASLASVSAGESGPGSILSAAGVKGPRAHLVNSWPGGTPGMDQLRTWLTAHPQVRLVVVDVLTLMRGISPSDPLSAGGYAGDYKLLRALKEVADDTHVSMVVITHTTKGRSSGDVFDTILGGRGVTGAADAMMVLEETARPSGMGSSSAAYSRWGTLAVRGRDVADQVIPLELTDGRWIERTAALPPVGKAKTPKRAVATSTTPAPIPVTSVTIPVTAGSPIAPAPDPAFATPEIPTLTSAPATPTPDPTPNLERTGNSKKRIARVLDRLGTEGATIAEICDATGVDAPRVAKILEDGDRAGDYVEFEGFWRSF